MSDLGCKKTRSADAPCGCEYSNAIRVKAENVNTHSNLAWAADV